jgi:hypothetical protein
MECGGSDAALAFVVQASRLHVQPGRLHHNASRPPHSKADFNRGDSACISEPSLAV